MAAAIVIALGLLQTIIKGEFPGVTWFIVRLAVSFPFILGWTAIAGNSRTSNTAGSILLTFLLTTYTHYLAPIGLPNPSLRIFAENPPAIDVHWLSYRDEFLIMLPVTLILSALAFFFANRYLGHNNIKDGFAKKYTNGKLALIIAGAFLLVIGVFVYNYTGPDVHRVKVASTGPANVEQGDFIVGK